MEKLLTLSESPWFRAFERHIQTGIGFALVGIAGFIANVVWDMQISQTALREQISSLREQVMAVQRQLDGVYTQRAAERDFTARDTLLMDHSRRIRALEAIQMDRPRPVE